MRIDEALRFGTKALQTEFTDPRREASWLLAAALGTDELALRLEPTRSLSCEVEERYRLWISRRKQRVPAEHLLGWCSFWDRRFLVSPAVLIPRPETEFLIQAVLDLELPERTRMLDVGVGSGCIALTLRAERPGWDIVGVDRSLAALEVAHRNSRALGLPINLVAGHLATAISSSLDIVTANLPYIPSSSLPGLSAEVGHDPVLALDGGNRGLDLIEELLDHVGDLLSPDGYCVLELGENQREPVRKHANKRGFSEYSCIRDLGSVDRILVLRAECKSSSQIDRGGFSLQNDRPRRNRS